MPTESTGFLKEFSAGLKQAIPLMMQKLRMDAAENRFNQEMKFNRDKLAGAAMQAKDKIMADIEAARIQREFEAEQNRIQDIGKRRSEELKAFQSDERAEERESFELEKQRLANQGRIDAAKAKIKSFGKTFPGPLGNLLQTEEGTGQTRTVSRKPQPQLVAVQGFDDKGRPTIDIVPKEGGTPTLPTVKSKTNPLQKKKYDLAIENTLLELETQILNPANLVGDEANPVGVKAAVDRYNSLSKKYEFVPKVNKTYWGLGADAITYEKKKKQSKQDNDPLGIR